MNTLLGLKQTCDDFTVEYDIITPVELTDTLDIRRQKINNELNELQKCLDANKKTIDEINANIDRLTNHADGLDYIIAVGSGVLAGIVDSLWVGEFSLERGKEWSNEKVNNFVTELAKKMGYKSDELKGAIRYLEQFGTPSDSVTQQFGGGKQHHLRDFAHHPTLVGLIFSLLTQFTGMAYGTKTSGAFTIVPVEDQSFIGRNLPEKVTFGLVYWFLHMASDMAGSSSNPGAGTGLPGPILSFLKELSSIPVFNNSEAVQDLRVNISKLFNGTLLAQRDENGKIIKGPDGKPLIERFDLRTEIGVAYEIGRQAIPVVISEALVRGFYFLRRLTQQLKEKGNIKDIEWEKTLPFKNRTIVRMMTIATGTFMAIDLADSAIRAGIKSGGSLPVFLTNFVLRINFVGIGRFAIACGSDIKMGLNRNRLRNERINIYNQQIHLNNAKLFYKQANMWIEAEDTEKAIEEVYQMIEKSKRYFIESMVEINDSIKNIEEYTNDINVHNPGLIDEICDILMWE